MLALQLRPASCDPLPEPKVTCPPFTVRRARREELDAIVAIEAAAFDSRDRFARANLRRLMQSQSAVMLIAEEQGAAAGYAVVLTRRGSEVARLYSIAVAPAAAGRGAGSALLAGAAACAAAGGANRLRLEVRSSNLAARRLYERAGFSQHDEKPGYYGDGETAIRYEMRLGGGNAGGRSAQR